MIEHPNAKERAQERAERERARQQKILTDHAEIETVVDQIIAGGSERFSIDVTSYEHEAVAMAVERYYAAGWVVVRVMSNAPARTRTLEFS